MLLEQRHQARTARFSYDLTSSKANLLANDSTFWDHSSRCFSDRIVIFLSSELSTD